MPASHTKENDMMMIFHEASLEVRRQQVLSLRDAAGASLRCTRGSLWLTHEGGGRDIVLAPGECFTVERNGLTLVSALKDGSVLIASAPARREVTIGALTMRWLRGMNRVTLRRHPAAGLHGGQQICLTGSLAASAPQVCVDALSFSTISAPFSAIM
jgi:hypothetical protein